MSQLPFLLLAGCILCGFFLVSFSSQKLRLPSVLVYIALGTALAKLFPDQETIHLAGEIGIVLLFFILGLEFPLARMLEISRKVWSAGLLDVVLKRKRKEMKCSGKWLSCPHAAPAEARRYRLRRESKAAPNFSWISA